jgi:hypothetical protein
MRDYPLRWREFDNSDYEGPEQLRPVDFSLQILGWAVMQGHGATREEAAAKLEENLAYYVAAGNQLPRPGTYKPIEFASTQKIGRFAEIEADFLRNILDLEWAFLSDESSLWDFSQGDALDELYRRIEERYGVDVSDVEGGNLAKIFERIETAQKKR